MSFRFLMRMIQAMAAFERNARSQSGNQKSAGTFRAFLIPYILKFLVVADFLQGNT
jgi:phage gp29-like protein